MNRQKHGMAISGWRLFAVYIICIALLTFILSCIAHAQPGRHYVTFERNLPKAKDVSVSYSRRDNGKLLYSLKYYSDSTIEIQGDTMRLIKDLIFKQL